MKGMRDMNGMQDMKGDMNGLKKMNLSAMKSDRMKWTETQSKYEHVFNEMEWHKIKSAY